MHRSDAIARLQNTTDRLRAAGVRALYMFGSVARDEAIETSDVDVFVDPDYERFSFVELIRIEEFLSTQLGRKVDLTTREGLHPLLRADIEREAIRVL
jgi:predicted nucleotidyltransferase